MMMQYITMLPKIAWRNVWRSKARSFVVIGAVAVGIWALIFLLGFVRGVTFGYINRAIQLETSHLQIHHPQFLEDREIKYAIPQVRQKLDAIRDLPEVRSVSARLMVNAMISSAHGVRGIRITGVDPEAEAATTTVANSMTDGTFFGEASNEIVVSRTIIEKLNVEPGKKVVVTFQNSDFDLTSAAYRVAGIFETGNKAIDESVAYVKTEDLLPLTGLSDGSAHEIAILLHQIDSTEALQSRIASSAPQMQVQTFRQISPDLDLFDSQIRVNMIIMTAIIMLALIFGIINTMLMAVLERVRELGMLMAIGMTRIRVFLMIVWETIFVAVLGAPIGLLLGYFTIAALHRTGVDLSMWAQGLSQFGMSTMIYPELETDAYIFIAVSIILTALIAAVYPSFKAIRLRPVEALRKI